jgi:hypothetical protein
MFDDNYPGPISDNLSMKIACALDLGQFSNLEVQYTDNFNKTWRPLRKSDLIGIHYMFEHVIITYYEHLFPWRRDNHIRQILFPEFDWRDMMFKFPMSFEPSYHEASAFVNIAYLQLTPFNTMNMTSLQMKSVDIF